MKSAKRINGARCAIRHAVAGFVLMLLCGSAWGSPPNVSMEFTARSGALLADVRVVIFAADNSIVLDALSEGPRLQTTLAPGSYRIKATFGGRTLFKHLVLGDDRSTSLSFVWPVADLAGVPVVGAS